MLVVIAQRIQFRPESKNDLPVSHIGKLRCRKVSLEGVEDFAGFIHKIQDVRVVFAWIATIETRQRLYRLNSRQPFIDVHPAKQWLIKPGLEFVRDQQDLKQVIFEGFCDVSTFQVWIQFRAGFFEWIGS